MVRSTALDAEKVGEGIEGVGSGVSRGPSEMSTAGINQQGDGWKEVYYESIPQETFLAAIRTKATVQGDLALPAVRIRWFAYDPAAVWDLSTTDIPLAHLNTPPFDPDLAGKALPPSIREYGCPVIWVRADLPVGGMVFVVAHECRHIWQWLTWSDKHSSDEELEMDATVYPLRDAPLPADLLEASRRWFREHPDVAA